MKDDLDNNRRKDKIEEFKRIPLALIIMIFWIAILYLMTEDRITIDGIPLYGASIEVWALVVEILVGLALIYGVRSLVLIFWLGALAKYGGFRLHPWKPIIHSAKLLIICFSLLVLFNYAQTFILDNAKQFNNALAFHNSTPFYIQLIPRMAYAFIAFMILFIFSFILFYMVRAPFNAKEQIESLRKKKSGMINE